VNSPLFSIAICTYNRADILREALTALTRQQKIKEDWELLLINNNSTDHTQEVMQTFLSDNPDVNGRYIVEHEQGLSRARNRAIVESQAPWIFYLDDDAKLKENGLQRLAYLVQEAPYKIVGGVYYPWYYFGKPHWYKDRYVSNALKHKELTELGRPFAASGCVMLWEKALLEQLGGFDPSVGMTGKKIAYGEETYLQESARDRGTKIAYDPELVIYHIVLERKLNIDWFFKSHFAAGRDSVIGEQIGRGILPALGQIGLGWLVMTKDFILCTPKLLNKDYYVENWLIDVFRKFAKRLGSAYTSILMASRD
jgi:glycosyltransferase involved in cell wall biosynthesis